jgi:hypothetical protein
MSTRRRADNAVRHLWLAFRDLSDAVVEGSYEMSEDDLILWGHVTRHRAVQERLAKAERQARRGEE